MTESRPSILLDLGRLGGRAALFGLGTVFLRGLTFLLLPVYTRYLLPETYGVVAVTTTVSSILGILLPLSLHSIATQSYFESADGKDRGERLFTLWVAMIISSTVLLAIVELAGPALSRILIPDVPFNPYLRIAAWTALFGVFAVLPLNLLQIRERAGLYALGNGVAALLTVAIVLDRLIRRNEGAYGYLVGTMIATGLMALPYSVWMLRQIRFRFRWDVFRAAVGYGLPILPHLLASWVLSLSDRIILERYRSSEEVGLYFMGYQIASLLTIAAAAMNSAWAPFLFRTVSEQGERGHARLAQLVTYLVLGLCWLALGLALLGRYLVQFLIAPSYLPCIAVIPWCVGGFLLAGLYYVPVNILYLKSKTKWIPLATIGGGAVSLIMNFSLIPQWGMKGTAFSCLAANAVMLGITWFAASRVMSFPYEYGRLVRTLATASVLFTLAVLFGAKLFIPEFWVRLALSLLFPAALSVTGFLNPAERARLLRLLSRAKPLGGGSTCL